MKTTLHSGLTDHLKYVVPVERTVPYLLPEASEFTRLPKILATGYMVAIMEWTCMRTLIGHLDDDEATLGVQINVSHVAPTPPGALLIVEATLTRVEGRHLYFEVHAHDDVGEVGSGTHDRAVINVNRFQTQLGKRESQRGEPSRTIPDTNSN